MFNKKLSVLSLALITVGSVDSIRNLPAAAMAGNQLFNYYLLALFFFLLPCAIVTVWLSKHSSQGIYGWVKKGLGQPFAVMAVWFQCIQNVLLYPTLLSFITGSLLYSFAPSLVDNKLMLFGINILLIVILTWINLKGLQLSSFVNSLCTIVGLLIPFSLIIIMGSYWWLTGVSTFQFLQQSTSYSWASLTGIILSFCGIDLAAVHIEESQTNAFPKSMAISVSLIFITMLLGSIILAITIPTHQLSFIGSIPELITIFFAKAGLADFSLLINCLIAIGCLGSANNWLIAPIKGLRFAAEDGILDPKYSKLNEHHAPKRLLILQALCVSILNVIFLIAPSINSSYWLMINTATQIYLLMYILLFLSAIKIIINSYHSQYNLLLITSGIGLIGISSTLMVSLSLPPTFHLGSQLSFACFNALALLLIIIIPYKAMSHFNRY